MKRYIRPLIAGIMAVSMVLPLCACKKKSGKKTQKVSENDPYFNVEEHEIKLDLDTDKKVEYQSLNNPKIIGNSIVASYNINYEVPKELMAEMESLYSNINSMPSQEEVDAISEKMRAYYVTGLAFFNLQGELVSKIDTEQSDSIMQLKDDGNGNILVFLQRYDMYDPMAETKDILVTYSPEGEKIGEMEVAIDRSGGDYFWVENMEVMKDGQILLISYDKMVLIDKQGNQVGEIAMEGDGGGKVISVGDDYYLSSYSYESDHGESYLQKISLNPFKLEEEKKKSKFQYWNSSSNSNGKFYMLGSNGIMVMDPLSDKAEEYMNWDSTDVNYANLMNNSSFEVVSDDEVLFVWEKWYQEENGDWVTSTYVDRFTRADKNPNAGKTYIEMGTFGMPNSDFIDYVVEYNKTEGNKARMRLYDYSEGIDYSDGGDKALAEMSDKVYLDLLGGSGPDILLNFSGFSQFNSEEVLVDLNTYIDGSNGLNRDEYFDNIFRAFETKGKMFQIPICVDIQGLLGNKDMIGERTGWTYSEFTQIVEGLPEDVSVFEDMLHETLLEKLLSHAMGNLIDYAKKEVYFDGDEFKQILQIAKKYGVDKLPEEMGEVSTYEVYGDGMMEPMGSGNTPQDRMNEGMLALMDTYVYDIRMYAENTSICNGKCIYVGMPSPDGTGVSAAPMMTLAISAASNNKEEAWDFICRLYDEESQYKYTRSMNSVALNRKAFDRINEDVIKECEQQRKDYEEYAAQYGEDEMWRNSIPEITDEHKEGFKKLVESISTITASDMAVVSIIKEEAAAYFSGQQDIDTVCKNIQNRTANIVRER